MLPDGIKDKIIQNLSFRKSQLEAQIKNLDQEDPILLESVFVPSELGTDSWEAGVHANKVVSKSHMSSLYVKIQHALKRLHEGSYGKCEKCGKLIELQRLEILPTATHCTLCL